MSGTRALLEDGKSVASGIALSCLATGQKRSRTRDIATAVPASLAVSIRGGLPFIHGLPLVSPAN
jgi:hypothetical protein